MKLYHGSVTRDIQKLSFDKSRQRFNRLVEGEGIYLTESHDVAKSYSGGGSVYHVDFRGNLLDATKKDSFVEIIKKVEEEFSIKILETPYVESSLESIEEGDFSVSTFGEDIVLILENDEKFLETLTDYEFTEKIKNSLNTHISNYDGFKYYDKSLDNGESLVFLITNEETLKIIKEEYVEETIKQKN